jgi:hypothetical protein
MAAGHIGNCFAIAAVGALVLSVPANAASPQIAGVLKTSRRER